MSNRVFLHDTDEDALEWAIARIDGVTQFRSDARAIEQRVDGQTVAVVVYDNFSTGSCFIHVASDGGKRWLTRDFLVVAFAYPFIQCGFRRITALIASKNEASLKLNLGLGFVKEGLLREELPDDDMIVTGLLRRECAYLPPEDFKHG